MPRAGRRRAPDALGDDLTAAAAAAEAVRLAAIDSHRALELAGEARTALRSAPDPEAAPLVERALGLVGIELGRMPEAVRHLRRAVRLADAAGLDREAAEARLDLSAALVLHGRPESGLAEAERARAVLKGSAAARSLMRRALILQRRGHYREALDGYRQALAGLRRADDREYEARLLCNRGVLHAFRGEFAAAEADLRRAERLHAQQGRPLQVAHIHHNLAWLAARRGDAPAALALYDRTDEEYRELGSDRGVLLQDRCEVLLSVNLVAESRETAEQAVAELERSHLDSDLPEARLTLAHAALLDGDPETAREQARRADRAFTRQRRCAWAALARAAALRAAWAAGERSPALLASARRTATELAARGWAAEALDARIIAGRVALELGRPGVAARELERAGAARRRGPVRLRVAAWHAEALLRAARGNARGARAAVGAGLRVVEAHRAALGATELRAQATAHAAELGAMGVRLALASGRARAVLAALERCRASTWDIRPPRPPLDPALAHDLAELRQVAGEIRTTVLDGGDPAPLLQRQRHLEGAVRRRSHHARGAAGAPDLAIPAPQRLIPRLGERALVDLIDSGGRLAAVTLAGGRARLWDLGPSAAAVRELATLSFALRRLALGTARPATASALAATATEAARRLDAIVLAPLARELDGRPLVIVPTAELHATPWPALASCAGRPLTVAPSATLWHRCSAPAVRAPGPPLLVAGPGLPEAAAEVRALRGQYPNAVCLVGEAATAAAVTEAFGRAGLAHIAAHGRFRGDNPLFSALDVADGPLTVYDLEAAGSAPDRLVLSACDSALGTVVGAELMGLLSSLFTLGTRTVVGSVVPVRDDQTRELMVRLHGRLRAGRSPAEALAACQAELPSASTFVCFGAG